MKEIRLASISDVHLWHPNTPTEHIVANLNRDFPDNEETGRLDAIIFGGDQFDRSLPAHHPDVIHAKLWIYRMIRLCKKHDIELWVLEGTPSHDWKNSVYFTFINEAANLNAKVRYINTLTIEHSERLGYVLFIPDEWPPGPDDTWRQVQELLAQKNLTHVDYAVIHGSFRHQLPPVVKSPMHDPDRYLSITRKYVMAGHVHKASQYKERFLTNGSYDRLAQGEEDAKGHWRLTVREGGRDDIVFVENVGAKLYKTIDCRNLSVEDALEKLTMVASFPDGSAVRVEATRQDAILASLDILRRKYPRITWSSKSEDSIQVQAKMLVDLRGAYTQIPLTPQNLPDLIMSRIRQMTDVPALIERCQQRLMESIE